jgi:hypothetical protein
MIQKGAYFVSVSSIGVQQILPTSGIGGHDDNPAMDDASSPAADGASSSPSPAPAVSGTGQVVDKTA